MFNLAGILSFPAEKTAAPENQDGRTDDAPACF
jgi:hypothetical protein